MKKLLLLCLCCLLFTACKVDVPPIESAFTGEVGGGEGQFTTELPPDHLKALAEWFAAHKSGWKFGVIDLPPGPGLILNHRGGRRTIVRLLVNNHLWVGNHYKILSATEAAAFTAFFNPDNHLPVFNRPKR